MTDPNDLKELAVRVDAALRRAWNAHDIDAFLALFAQQFTWEDPMRKLITTLGAVRAEMEGWFSTFANLRIALFNDEIIVAGNGLVQGRIRLSGVHRGSLTIGDQRFAATGREINVDGTYQTKINEQGLIVYFRTGVNERQLMEQLGIQP